LLDSFLQDNPDDPELLGAAANLYASYGAVFADDPARAARLTERARDYAARAICLSYDAACGWPDMPFDAFAASLPGLSSKHVDAAYSYAMASLASIRAH